MSVRLTIKELRLKHPDKPSQRFMGDLLGMTESNYRKLETNRLESVKLEHINTIIEFFKCQITDVLEYVENT